MKTHAAVLSALLVAACGDTSRIAETAQTGPNPELPAPQSSLIPTVNIATAKGWSQGAAPQPAAGLAVSAYASGLDHPRWVYVLPNGDVLVAETAAPQRPEDGKGVKGWVMKKFMQRAGSAVPSANCITLLRDADGDGRPETRTIFLENLNSPFGMALVGNDLYVANTDAVLRFQYRTGITEIKDKGAHVADLPGGPLKALVPDYALGSHVAPLGLAFYDKTLLPQRYAGGAFIGMHGSWNRKPRSGYKVAFIPFSGGRPSGPLEDILTGFVDDKGNAMGRPVGVAVDGKGALLVADDVGNVIWRVTPAQ